MKKTLLFALFVCISFLSISQSTSFTGSVIEEENNVSIPDAIIAVEGTAIAQRTNNNGEFSFYEKIPSGEQIVTVTKEGYEVKYFLINVVPGNKVIVNPIEIVVTSKEKKRRKKLAKSARKDNKKNEKLRAEKIKEARKQGEKSDKKLAKERRKLKKRNKDVIVSYDETPIEEVSVDPYVEVITPLQIKYAGLLGITPEEITNFALYEFIDSWIETPYLMGGENKDGIDCSSFSLRLFTKVYDLVIERTAEKQFKSKYTDKFIGKEFLKEGDLLFFKGVGDYSNNISHVGVYLGNNKFVNATSRRGSSGVSGVKISDLSESFWQSRFVSAGRRINNK